MAFVLLTDMQDGNDSSRLTRRTVLKGVAGAGAITGMGTVQADETDREPSESRLGRCPDATLEPSHGYCAGASLDGCADDHEVTIELREAVDATLSDRYPDAAALLDDGFKPYFDTLNGGDSWSHWLSPEYIGDDRLLDPDRPESVLVDNESWRSIGAMFIATRDGESVSPPPVVYDDDLDVTYEDGIAPVDAEPATVPIEHDDEEDGDHGAEGDGQHDGDGDDHHGADGPEDRCSPWHYHAGLPGRFAWWYYRTVYEGEVDLTLPCRTPCMMHVWTVDHPDGVYAHDGPPPEYPDREPADEAGFETDGEPGEDTLDWDVLPDALTPDRLPEEFSVLDR